MLHLLFLHGHPAHRDLHSFPTRRSSDLSAKGRFQFSALRNAAVRFSRVNGKSTCTRAAAGRSVLPKEVESVISAIGVMRSEEHTSELQSRFDLVCRLLLEKKKKYVLPHV